MKTFNELTKCVLVGACLLLSIVVNAQIKGKVLSSEDNTPLPGVSIIVKGTSKGAITDTDGQFSLDAKAGDPLMVSFVGYKTLEVNASNDLSIQLESSSEALSEVVVTALGISREKKSLGYAVQDVKGENLTVARENNLVSSLAGKVAGLTIVNNTSGVGGSARVTIRGERSLNINKNQPLFVIDGVPISNELNGNSGRSYQDVDYGNGAAMVNADDVETVTVLKGASASALYGSRANNGVILITTKSGKNSKGFGISYNQNVTFESALKLPEYQNTYGQGVVRFGFVDGNGGGLADGTDESWGPRMTGQLLPQAESPRVSGLRGGDTKAFRPGDTILYTPFSARPDNVKDFFETGRNITTSIALAGSNDKGDLRLSFTNIDATGIVPNTDLNRSTLTFNGGYNLTPRFKVNTNISYVNSKSNNRPNLSYGTENIMYLFNCWLGRQVDLGAHREYWQRGLEGTQQFNFNYNYHDNPYFGLFENTNGQKVNRIFGNVRLSYDFTDWLSLQLRGGTDVNNEFRPRRRAFSTQRFKFGTYREEKVQFEETNFDLLLRVNKNITNDLTFNATFGGNQMRQNRDELDVTAPQLLIPGIYSLNNTRVELQSDQFRSERRINSVYGSASFGYKGIYLDLTARNDWSSTLPISNNSYFYPSVNVSAVLSDMIKLPSAISYAKVRGGFAQVGSDTDPFQLTTPYNASTPYGTFRTFGESGRLVNPELRPELSTSFEAGTEWRFLGSRIGLDLTYYQTTTKDQILAIPLTNTSGYDSRVINAGKVRNWGIEAMINLVPVKTKDFTWNVDFNVSANRSEVLELTDGIKNFVMASRYVTVEARVGQRMGEMYGIGYQRVNDPNSPFNGQIINGSTGRPLATTERIALGNYNPDWLAGINNTVRYKNIALSFLFDIRQGGKIYSHTQTVGREGGMIIETLEGRRNETDGYNLTLDGNGVIAPGVIRNADGTYRANDVKLSAREWHTAITGGRSIIEGMMYDASFVKLREARLTYTLPNTWFGNSSLRDVSFSLVGRNLLLFDNVPHIDPENASTADGTIIPGVESVSIPSTRSMGVNLSLKF